MKTKLSLLLVVMALSAALCACNATTDDYEIPSDARSSGEIMDRQDSSAGYTNETDYPGTNGYGDTNGAVRYGSTERYNNDTSNASANETLHGTYNAPTGMRGEGQNSSTVTENEMEDPYADEVRYRLMLDNAAVHDSDGFLFDEENPHHDTM